MSDGRNAAVLGYLNAGLRVDTIIQSGYPLTIQQSDNFTSGIGYGKQRPTLTGQSYFGASVGDSIGNVGQGQTGSISRTEPFLYSRLTTIL